MIHLQDVEETPEKPEAISGLDAGSFDAVEVPGVSSCFFGIGVHWIPMLGAQINSKPPILRM
jgi:hypothetical protein